MKVKRWQKLYSLLPARAYGGVNNDAGLYQLGLAPRQLERGIAKERAELTIKRARYNKYKRPLTEEAIETIDKFREKHGIDLCGKEKDRFIKLRLIQKSKKAKKNVTLPKLKFMED